MLQQVAKSSKNKENKEASSNFQASENQAGRSLAPHFTTDEPTVPRRGSPVSKPLGSESNLRSARPKIGLKPVTQTVSSILRKQVQARNERSQDKPTRFLKSAPWKVPDRPKQCLPRRETNGSPCGSAISPCRLVFSKPSSVSFVTAVSEVPDKGSTLVSPTRRNSMSPKSSLFTTKKRTKGPKFNFPVCKRVKVKRVSPDYAFPDMMIGPPMKNIIVKPKVRRIKLKANSMSQTIIRKKMATYERIKRPASADRLRKSMKKSNDGDTNILNPGKCSGLQRSKKINSENVLSAGNKPRLCNTKFRKRSHQNVCRNNIGYHREEASGSKDMRPLGVESDNGESSEDESEDNLPSGANAVTTDHDHQLEDSPVKVDEDELTSLAEDDEEDSCNEHHAANDIIKFLGGPRNFLESSSDTSQSSTSSSSSPSPSSSSDSVIEHLGEEVIPPVNVYADSADDNDTSRVQAPRLTARQVPHTHAESPVPRSTNGCNDQTDEEPRLTVRQMVKCLQDGMSSSDVRCSSTTERSPQRRTSSQPPARSIMRTWPPNALTVSPKTKTGDIQSRAHQGSSTENRTASNTEKRPTPTPRKLSNLSDTTADKRDNPKDLINADNYLAKTKVSIVQAENERAESLKREMQQESSVKIENQEGQVSKECFRVDNPANKSNEEPNRSNSTAGPPTIESDVDLESDELENKQTKVIIEKEICVNSDRSLVREETFVDVSLDSPCEFSDGPKEINNEALNNTEVENTAESQWTEVLEKAKTLYKRFRSRSLSPSQVREKINFLVERGKLSLNNAIKSWSNTDATETTTSRGPDNLDLSQSLRPGSQYSSDLSEPLAGPGRASPSSTSEPSTQGDSLPPIYCLRINSPLLSHKRRSGSETNPHRGFASSSTSSSRSATTYSNKGDFQPPTAGHESGIRRDQQTRQIAFEKKSFDQSGPEVDNYASKRHEPTTLALPQPTKYEPLPQTAHMHNTPISSMRSRSPILESILETDSISESTGFNLACKAHDCDDDRSESLCTEELPRDFLSESEKDNAIVVESENREGIPRENQQFENKETKQGGFNPTCKLWDCWDDVSESLWMDEIPKDRLNESEKNTEFDDEIESRAKPRGQNQELESGETKQDIKVSDFPHHHLAEPEENPAVNDDIGNGEQTSSINQKLESCSDQKQGLKAAEKGNVVHPAEVPTRASHSDCSRDCRYDMEQLSVYDDVSALLSSAPLKTQSLVNACDAAVLSESGGMTDMMAILSQEVNIKRYPSYHDLTDIENDEEVEVDEVVGNLGPGESLTSIQAMADLDVEGNDSETSGKPDLSSCKSCEVKEEPRELCELKDAPCESFEGKDDLKNKPSSAHNVDKNGITQNHLLAQEVNDCVDENELQDYGDLSLWSPYEAKDKRKCPLASAPIADNPRTTQKNLLEQALIACGDEPEILANEDCTVENTEGCSTPRASSTNTSVGKLGNHHNSPETGIPEPEGKVGTIVSLIESCKVLADSNRSTSPSNDSSTNSEKPHHALASINGSITGKDLQGETSELQVLHEKCSQNTKISTDSEKPTPENDHQDSTFNVVDEEFKPYPRTDKSPQFFLPSPPDESPFGVSESSDASPLASEVCNGQDNIPVVENTEEKGDSLRNSKIDNPNNIQHGEIFVMKCTEPEYKPGSENTWTKDGNKPEKLIPALPENQEVHTMKEFVKDNSEVNSIGNSVQEDPEPSEGKDCNNPTIEQGNDLNCKMTKEEQIEPNDNEDLPAVERVAEISLVTDNMLDFEEQDSSLTGILAISGSSGAHTPDDAERNLRSPKITVSTEQIRDTDCGWSAIKQGSDCVVDLGSVECRNQGSSLDSDVSKVNFFPNEDSGCDLSLNSLSRSYRSFSTDDDKSSGAGETPSAPCDVELKRKKKKISKHMNSGEGPSPQPSKAFKVMTGASSNRAGTGSSGSNLRSLSRQNSPDLNVAGGSKTVTTIQLLPRTPRTAPTQQKSGKTASGGARHGRKEIKWDDEISFGDEDGLSTQSSSEMSSNRCNSCTSERSKEKGGINCGRKKKKRSISECPSSAESSRPGGRSRAKRDKSYKSQVRRSPPPPGMATFNPRECLAKGGGAGRAVRKTSAVARVSRSLTSYVTPQTPVRSWSTHGDDMFHELSLRGAPCPATLVPGGDVGSLTLFGVEKHHNACKGNAQHEIIEHRHEGYGTSKTPKIKQETPAGSTTGCYKQPILSNKIPGNSEGITNKSAPCLGNDDSCQHYGSAHAGEQASNNNHSCGTTSLDYTSNSNIPQLTMFSMASRPQPLQNRPAFNTGSLKSLYSSSVSSANYYTHPTPTPWLRQHNTLHTGYLYNSSSTGDLRALTSHTASNKDHVTDNQKACLVSRLTRRVIKTDLGLTRAHDFVSRSQLQLDRCDRLIERSADIIRRSEEMLEASRNQMDNTASSLGFTRKQ